MAEVENEVVVTDRRVLLDMMAQIYEIKDSSEINEDEFDESNSTIFSKASGN